MNGRLRESPNMCENEGTTKDGSRPVRQHHVGGFLTLGLGGLVPVSSHDPAGLSAGSAKPRQVPRKWCRPGQPQWAVYGCNPQGQQVALYRFFDREGQLLYVGITSVPAYRFSAHVRKPWFKDALCYTTEMHPNRHAAAEAERVAIRTERPLHNIAGVML